MKLRSKQLRRLDVLKLKIRHIILNELNLALNQTVNKNAKNVAQQRVIDQSLPSITEYYTQINDEYGGCPIK